LIFERVQVKCKVVASRKINSKYSPALSILWNTAVRWLSCSGGERRGGGKSLGENITAFTLPSNGEIQEKLSTTLFVH
jgi:hypothetical protein